MTNERTETHACDCIDRQAAIEALEKLFPVFPMKSDFTQGTTCGIALAKVCIGKQVPAAEPERKTGRWIPQDHNRRNGYVTTTVYYYPKCSECGHSGSYSMSYCPSCGAFMGGDTE